MRFFYEYLNRFSAPDILHMYSTGAFRYPEEIKQADYAINYKIVFNDNLLSPRDLKIYWHLQIVVDKIRAQDQRRLHFNNDDVNYDMYKNQIFQRTSTTPKPMKHFYIYGEYEREVRRYNILERKIMLTFGEVEEQQDPDLWFKEALEELLFYVISDFNSTDRIGLVFNMDSCVEKSIPISIRLKENLGAIGLDNMYERSIQQNQTFFEHQSMVLQVVCIRFP